MSRSAVHGRFLGRVVLSALFVAGGCQVAAVIPGTSPGVSPTASPSASVIAIPTAAPSVSSASPTPSSLDVPLFGKLPGGKLDEVRAAALQRVLDTVVRDGAPDAIAAVITADGGWSGAAGVGGPDGRKATTEDEFAIASVTKTITASLVMRLVQQGRMDLDTPLASYLGDTKVDANGATVRQFLGARSGMADFVKPAEAIAADPSHHWTVTELLDRIPPAQGSPGGVSMQVGPNYILLGLAVEHVTGMSLSEALRSEVLDPVGATRIVQQGAGVDTPRPWALPTEGHLGAFKVGDLGAGGAISCISSASFGPGSGSIASDAPSLAAWTWHLFAGEIVDRASLTAMLPGADGHGLGIDALEAPLDRAIGLTGGKTGYGTVLAVIPSQQFVAVVFVNDETFRIDAYISDLIEAAQR